jgi:hypothetical protein
MSTKAISRLIAGAPDYEAGSWTPVLEGSVVAGSHTYANQGGQYVKIGPLVWVTGITALSAFDGAAAGGMLITGLPFVGSGGSHNSSAVDIARFQFVNLDTANGYYFPLLTAPGGVSYMQLLQFGDNVGDKAIEASDMANNSAIRVTGTYVTGTPSAG